MGVCINLLFVCILPPFFFLPDVCLEDPVTEASILFHYFVDLLCVIAEGQYTSWMTAAVL